MRGNILDADMHTVGTWILAGMRWWIAEISAIVPRSLRRGASFGSALLRYDTVAGLRHVDGRDEPLPANGAAILLPPGLCLIRTIERPAMSDADLAHMLALDSDRIMPLPPGEMIVAGRVLPGPAETGRAAIEVAGLPRERAIALADIIDAAAIAPQLIFVTAPAPGGAAPIDMLPAMRAAGLLPSPRNLAAYWWIAVGALVLLNVGIVIWRDAARVDRLEQIVAAQRPAIDTARRIQGRVTRINRIAAQTAALRARREPLALLRDLSAALPAGVWIQHFTQTGDMLRLAGYRPKAVDAVAAVRRVPRLAGVHYTDAESVAPVPDGQPFEISARIGAN